MSEKPRINENDFALFFFAALMKKGRTEISLGDDIRERLAAAYRACRPELERHCRISYRILAGIAGGDGHSNINDVFLWPEGMNCGYRRSDVPSTVYFKDSDQVISLAKRYGREHGIDIAEAMDRIVDATLDPSKLPKEVSAAA